MSTLTDSQMKKAIQQLKEEKNAIILAHNYQIPEIQDIADVVGDSLRLARQADQTDADIIVFCGKSQETHRTDAADLLNHLYRLVSVNHTLILSNERSEDAGQPEAGFQI